MRNHNYLTMYKNQSKQWRGIKERLQKDSQGKYRLCLWCERVFLISEFPLYKGQKTRNSVCCQCDRKSPHGYVRPEITKKILAAKDKHPMVSTKGFLGLYSKASDFKATL